MEKESQLDIRFIGPALIMLPGNVEIDRVSGLLLNFDRTIDCD